MEARDDETLVAVISDHGGTPGRWPQVSMARVLEDAGWLAYCEPTTGQHPFSLVLSHEDAEVVNLWGPLVGDIMFAPRPEFDGAHGTQLPSARLGIGAQHATFVLSGPGGRRRVRGARTAGLAPACHRRVAEALG